MMVLPTLVMISALVGITIATILYRTVNSSDRAFAVGVTMFLTILVTGVFLIAFSVTVVHRNKRITVTNQLSMRYPDVEFTRIGVVHKILQFNPKSNKDLRCAAILAHVNDQWYVSHGTVACSTVDQKSVATDPTQSDLTNEMNASNQYQQTQLTPPWWVNLS